MNTTAPPPPTHSLAAKAEGEFAVPGACSHATDSNSWLIVDSNTVRASAALYFLLFGLFIGFSLDNDTLMHLRDDMHTHRRLCTIGYAQLLVWLVLDTRDNYMSQNPRITLYLHHAVCTVALCVSLACTAPPLPLYIFGVLETVTVCRFAVAVSQKLFVMLRILTTCCVRIPMCIRGLWYAMRVLQLYDVEGSSTECFTWMTVLLLVILFDLYCVSRYVVHARRLSDAHSAQKND